MRRTKARQSDSPHGDWQARLLSAARKAFRERGYAGTTLEHVAHAASVDLGAVQAQFIDKDGLFAALMNAFSPLEAMHAALDSVQGDSAEELLRDAMHRLVKVAQDHADFFELAVIDSQINNGAHLATLSAKLFPKATELLAKMKATGHLRPVADVVLGRTLVAMLMGFVISERAIPQVARTAMRMLPQRAWLDGMIDLLIYGVIEDDAR